MASLLGFPAAAWPYTCARGTASISQKNRCLVTVLRQVRCLLLFLGTQGMLRLEVNVWAEKCVIGSLG